ncbi:hypothetical protein HGB07_05395 [Candidatus Roizmanbacteria bacterium]|nr:hypothetical protein [Candidatus Roizmanbacteria bacterium]
MLNIVSPSRYKLNRKHINEFVTGLFTKYDINQDRVVNIVYVGKRKMKEIASTYKHEDVALPVLAFPYVEESKADNNHTFGEIILCYPQVILLAAERSKKVDDMMNQLIEHGLRNIIVNASTPL